MTDAIPAQPAQRTKALRLWTAAALLVLSPIVLGPLLAGALAGWLARAGAADVQAGRDLGGSIGLMMAGVGVWAFVRGAHAWRPRRAQRLLLAFVGVLLAGALVLLTLDLVRFVEVLRGG